MKQFSEHQLSLMHALKYYGKDYPVNTGGILHLYNQHDLPLVEEAVSKLLNDVDILHYKFNIEKGEIYEFCGDKHIKIDYFDFTDLWQEELLQTYFQAPLDINKRLYKVAIIKGIDRISVLFIVHHLISDSRTLHLLATKLLNILDNKTDFDIDAYDDYLKEETNYLESNQFDKDHHYWINEVRILKPALVKPLKVGPLLDDISQIKHELSAEETEKIDAFILEYGGSPQVLFELILAYELSLVNSSSTVTLGITAHNRNKKSANIAGMLVSTLPLKIDLKVDSTILDNYKNIIRKHFEIYRHRMFPYRHILKAAHDSNITPLFDAMVIFHSPYEQTFNLAYQLETLANKKSVLGLVLNIEKRSPHNQYMLSFDFKNSLFTAAEQFAYLQRFLHYLKLVITTPTKQLRILGATGKGLAPTLDETIKLPPILTLFKNQVLKKPNKIALINHNNQITYKTLDYKSSLLAAKISSLNINEQVVFIDLTDKISAVISLLAVLKSNNTYAFFPDNLNPKLKETYEKVAKSALTINDEFLLNIEAYRPEHGERSNPILALYFTSGTTGEPKGVKIKDESVTNYCMQKIGYPAEVKKLNSLLNFSSLYFDISLENIFLALLNGLSVVFGDLDRLSDQSLIDNDALSLTPSILRYLLENKPEILHSLQLIISGGELLGRTLVNKIKAITKAKIYNSYGPTETTIAVTYALVTEDEITLGKPFSGCQITINNAQFLALPNGYIGEIVIEGTCLAAGYTQDYADSGFKKDKGRNYYKTGDYGYINDAGNLVFVGRKDYQIKKNGVRIELEQIDKMLLNHPRVVQAKTGAIEQTIITNVVVRGETSQSLYRYLKRFLPSFYLPNQIIIRDELFFNEQGKTTFVSAKKTNKVRFKAKTPYEKLFLKTLKKVVNIKELYESDTLLDIGADSLDILTLMVELDNAGINLPLTKFYEVSRISDLISLGREKQTEITPLKTHNLKNNSPIKEIKHVLLLGSTGFLGAHVLHNLLKQTNLEISVLVRAHQAVDAARYFEERVNYYFNDPLMVERIKLYSADISEEKFGLDSDTYQTLSTSVDAVINCAAKVDYVGKKRDFMKSNVFVTERIIEFSKIKNIPVFHTSTIGLPLAEKQRINENDLLSEQKYFNYYLETKRRAEDILLDYKKSNNTPLYLLRVGNLMPRQSDYKFQINQGKNAIYQLVKQALPKGGMAHKDYEIDLTPVDLAAEMIVNIIKNQPTQVTYHLYAPYVINSERGGSFKINNHYKLVNQKTTLETLLKNNIKINKIPQKYIANVLKIWRESSGKF